MRQRFGAEEDAPLIEEQRIAPYNKRWLTPLGKLVVGIHKFFEVEFGRLPVGGVGEVFVANPFFEQPDWIRLPSLERPPGFFHSRDKRYLNFFLTAS